MDNWYGWHGGYGLAGIFFDDAQNVCGTGDSYVDLYIAVSTYTKQDHPGALTVDNPGSPADQCYSSAADVLVMFEGTYASYTTWSAPSWELDSPAEPDGGLADVAGTDRDRDPPGTGHTDRGGDRRVPAHAVVADACGERADPPAGQGPRHVRFGHVTGPAGGVTDRERAGGRPTGPVRRPQAYGPSRASGVAGAGERDRLGRRPRREKATHSTRHTSATLTVSTRPYGVASNASGVSTRSQPW